MATDLDQFAQAGTGSVDGLAQRTLVECAGCGEERPPALPGDRGGPPPPGVDVPGVILARAEIDYRRPAKYGDTLDIRLGIASVGRTSFTYEYEIVDAGGDLIATARTVIVSFDYAAGKPTPIPEAMKRRLTQPLI